MTKSTPTSTTSVTCLILALIAIVWVTATDKQAETDLAECQSTLISTRENLVKTDEILEKVEEAENICQGDLLYYYDKLALYEECSECREEPIRQCFVF
jgi:hypothetical protein